MQFLHSIIKIDKLYFIWLFKLLYLAVIGASPELMRAPNKSRINSTAPRYEPWPIRVKPSINWRSHILVTGSSKSTASSGVLAALTWLSRWHDQQLKHLESA